jgi:alkylmercury lyase
MDAALVLDWKLGETSMSHQYTIGKLAKAAGVPVSTVRYYEQRGLLKPEARTAASYRIYGPDSMTRLRFIRAAQSSGFTLEDIGALLEIRAGALDPCTEVQAILERRLRSIDEQLEELTRVRGVLRSSINWCRDPHEAGCCQVIDELDSVAAGTQPTTPAEMAGALANGLRNSLRNARTFVAAKRLLAKGKPVAPEDLAEELGEPLAEILAELDSVPSLERDAAGNLVGWGLTLKPTNHRFEVEGHELFTWCAFDTLFFPALLGGTATIRSTCPETGTEVQVVARPDGVDALTPPGAVLSLVLPDASSAKKDVRGAFCNHVHYFRDTEAAAGWLNTHPGASVLPVEEAFEVGRKLSEIILTEAGES